MNDSDVSNPPLFIDVVSDLLSFSIICRVKKKLKNTEK